jgi:hypothetical protein
MEMVKREAQLKKEGEQIFVSPDYEASIPEPPTVRKARARTLRE